MNTADELYSVASQRAVPMGTARTRSNIQSESSFEEILKGKQRRRDELMHAVAQARG